MKVHLLYRDRDLDLRAARASNERELRADLELDAVIRAMAAGDRFLYDVSNAVLMTSLDDPDAIRYRQAILGDCVTQPAVVREIYALAVEALERERRVWGGMMDRYPEGVLHRAVEVLKVLVEMLGRLRSIAEANAPAFQSDGFVELFATLASELDRTYMDEVAAHLRRLEFRDGVVMSAELGTANKGAGYVLRQPREPRRSLVDRVLMREPGAHTYVLPERDESGMRSLGELRNRGIAGVAAALGQSTDHILSFFRALRGEVGFYVACLNLRDALTARGGGVCIPDPEPVLAMRMAASELYDVALRLTMDGPIVPNNVDADGKRLVMITGANRGGKSTFLRAVGLAQLMMQAGLFVGAASFRASVASGVFTHYKREEDPTMTSGKLDEELARMSGVVDSVTPGALVLLNESLASTNEREGSEIAREIVRGFLECGVRVCYVTHLFDLAIGLHTDASGDAVFLRAERTADGERTFRLVEARPLPTSFGDDLYRRIFTRIARDDAIADERTGRRTDTATDG